MKEERKEEQRRKNPSFVTLFLQTLTNQGLDQESLTGGQDALTAVGLDGVEEDQDSLHESTLVGVISH
jgi:hypothetical protein